MAVTRHKALFSLTLAITGMVLSAIALVILNSVDGAAFAARGGGPSELPVDTKPTAPRGELVAGEPETLRLSADVAESLGIRSAEVEKDTGGRTLTLVGSLALDANHLARIHPRFGGEVVEIGAIQQGPTDGPEGGQTTFRQVQVGDKVYRDQLLAVIWCKDLGEKKSELVDGLSQLRLDRSRLEKLEEGYRRQAIPEASVRQARRDVEADLNAVSRAERTLRVWRLADAEVEAVRAEAERIGRRQGARDPKKEKQWARVEVRSPFAGVVLERNVAAGDIVDTSADLFKVADLSRLSVWAHVYEDKLPALLKLPRPVPWTVRLKSNPDDPPVPGRIDLIGNTIDPTQHTVLVRGSVDNPEERFRAGQFITATVRLPPPVGETIIPIGALVEDGRDSIVFVQPHPDEPRYTLRRVKVVRRAREHAFLAAVSRDETEGKDFQVLLPGERVVTAGALVLKAALDDLKILAKRRPSSLQARR